MGNEEYATHYITTSGAAMFTGEINNYDDATTASIGILKDQQVVVWSDLVCGIMSLGDNGMWGGS